MLLKWNFSISRYRTLSLVVCTADRDVTLLCLPTARKSLYTVSVCCEQHLKKQDSIKETLVCRSHYAFNQQSNAAYLI